MTRTFLSEDIILFEKNLTGHTFSNNVAPIDLLYECMTLFGVKRYSSTVNSRIG